MPAWQSLFADQLVNVVVGGGLVRLDFASIDTVPADGKGETTLAVTQRLTMPLQGFLKSVEMQQTILKSLLEAGVISQEPNKT
jgi:hypothetical protein